MAGCALLVSSDLFFIAKVKEAAAACSREVKTVRSHDALQREAAAGGEGGLLLIDLEKPTMPLEVLAGLARELAERNWKVVSFFSHVHVDTAEKAQQAGLPQPMARSKFVRVLPELLASL
jgi:hypothetical protein